MNATCIYFSIPRALLISLGRRLWADAAALNLGASKMRRVAEQMSGGAGLSLLAATAISSSPQSEVPLPGPRESYWHRCNAYLLYRPLTTDLGHIWVASDALISDYGILRQ